MTDHVYKSDYSDNRGFHWNTLQTSTYGANRYVAEHEITNVNYELKPHEAQHLACARLQWILEKTRPSLSGLLTEKEVFTLVDCFQAGLSDTTLNMSLATCLCFHHGVELEEYESTWLAELIDKLRELDTVQRLTLTDALEQTWHRGIVQGMQPREFLLTLGIELAGEDADGSAEEND